MTLPAPPPGGTHQGSAPDPAGPVEPDQVEVLPGEQGDPVHTRGLPGGRVVAVASLLVIAVAIVEALLQERIGLWAGVTLLAVSIVAPVITQHGDHSLPAMMPPLAFLAAVLIAGQWLLPDSANSLRTREAVMVISTLGPNALWVIAATILSVSIAAAAHFLHRRSHRRSTAAEA